MARALVRNSGVPVLARVERELSVDALRPLWWASGRDDRPIEERLDVSGDQIARLLIVMMIVRPQGLLPSGSFLNRRRKSA